MVRQNSHKFSKKTVYLQKELSEVKKSSIFTAKVSRLFCGDVESQERKSRREELEDNRIDWIYFWMTDSLQTFPIDRVGVLSSQFLSSILLLLSDHPEESEAGIK